MMIRNIQVQGHQDGHKAGNGMFAFPEKANARAEEHIWGCEGQSWTQLIPYYIRPLHAPQHQQPSQGQCSLPGFTECSMLTMLLDCVLIGSNMKAFTFLLIDSVMYFNLNLFIGGGVGHTLSAQWLLLAPSSEVAPPPNAWGTIRCQRSNLDPFCRPLLHFHSLNI